VLNNVRTEVEETVADLRTANCKRVANLTEKNRANNRAKSAEVLRSAGIL